MRNLSCGLNEAVIKVRVRVRVRVRVAGILAASVVATPAHSRAVLTPYVGNVTPTYTCQPAPHDNSVDINALLGQQPAVTLNVAAGVCNVTHPVVVYQTGSTLNGAGIGQTIFVTPTPLTINMIEVGTTAVSYRGTAITVSNLSTNGGVTGNAGNASKVGFGIHLRGGVTSSYITNVETAYGLDGINMSGSQITMAGIYSHDNRHAGFYAAGNQRLPPPYNVADQDTITGSTFDNNSLDNSSGKTWDNVDFDRGHNRAKVTYTVLGSAGALSNNSDILFADQATSAGGGDVADHNQVHGSQMAGIRVYGRLSNETITNNTIDDAPNCQATGVNVIGAVNGVLVAYNTLNSVPVGVYIADVKDAPEGPGNALTIDTNTFSICRPNRPAVSATDGMTNLHITNNTLNGAWLDTAAADQTTLVISNNH